MSTKCNQAELESYEYIDEVMATQMGIPVMASYVYDRLYNWRTNNGVKKGVLSRVQVKAFLGSNYQTGYFNTETGKQTKTRPNHSHYVQMYWVDGGNGQVQGVKVR